MKVGPARYHSGDRTSHNAKNNTIWSTMLIKVLEQSEQECAANTTVRVLHLLVPIRKGSRRSILALLTTCYLLITYYLLLTTHY